MLYKDKWILIIWAPGGQNRPYKSPKDFHSKTKDYKIYIRRYSNTVPAKQDEERELYNLAGNIPFDDRVHYNSELSDLKINLIKEYLGDVKSEMYDKVNDISIETLGRQMNIVEGAQEFIKPKNIGILMFSDNPQKFIPMSQIELVHFQKTSGDDVFIEKIFTGPIHEQIRSILKYIKNSILKEKVIKVPNKAEAIRVFNYPYAAIEEAVVNAVYHRGYEERNPIEVRIDKEKITIVSYPGPDKSIRKSDIDNGQVIVRRYRNRRIGDFLKELKLTEGRATGIPKIIRSMEINKSPKPIFDTDDDRTYFLVKLLINEYFIEDEVQDEVQDESIEKKHTITIDNLNITELRLVGLLNHSNMSKKEIALSLGYKSIPGNLRKAMDNLLNQGLIGYTIPDKIKSKNQKYKLTKLGQSFKKEN